ncbi:MAG TPA: endonuclease/exonuclease/phosphatase family protein [Gemmatimonadales bacterium]|nr:endonuclease/exonuclease/phosphatase family protein [Gemmatimonadales bacterium]
MAILWLAVDRLWWTLLFGYGPRWVWWPLVVVPLLARCRRTERVASAALTGGVVLFGLQGFQLPIGRLAPGADTTGGTLRLITFNAAVRGEALPKAIALATEQAVDVLVVVECPPFRGEAIARYREMGVERAGEICVWQPSHAPVEIELAEKPVREIGWSGTIGMVRGIEGVGGPLGVVHLRSVRNELSEFLDLSELIGQTDSMAARQQKRIGGSTFASRWFEGTEEGRPTLVVGDFNLIRESAVFRRDWGRWRDAFGAAGFGYGHTWNSSWYGLRIDHVLTDDSWTVRSARVGPDLGSDHRPLIVELRRRLTVSEQ